jgi:hypothetical protein
MAHCAASKAAASSAPLFGAGDEVRTTKHGCSRLHTDYGGESRVQPAPVNVKLFVVKHGRKIFPGVRRWAHNATHLPTTEIWSLTSNLKI